MTDTRDSFVNVKPVIVADAPEAHQVWLDIGVQHFTVGDYCETKEEADWHANQLRHALLSASPGERDGDGGVVAWRITAPDGYQFVCDKRMLPVSENCMVEPLTLGNNSINAKRYLWLRDANIQKHEGLQQAFELGSDHLDKAIDQAIAGESHE